MPANEPRALFIAIGGWPGSGKSTLAAALARELHLPLLAKDDIKEALMDGLGPPPAVGQSRAMGRAAVLILFRIARGCPGAVLDSTWYDYAIPLAAALPGRVVPVRCAVPRETAQARYRARTASRHPGHRDAERSEAELWDDPPGPHGLGPVLDVDNTAPVDVPALAAQLNRFKPAAAGSGRGRTRD